MNTKMQKSHFFVSGKQNVFRLYVIMRSAMNEFVILLSRSESIGPMSPISLISPICFFELTQKLNPLCEVVTHLNAVLTDFDACVTFFNGLFNARKSKINAH
jgi:hypothetical protein